MIFDRIIVQCSNIIRKYCFVQYLIAIYFFRKEIYVYYLYKIFIIEDFLFQKSIFSLSLSSELEVLWKPRIPISLSLPPHGSSFLLKKERRRKRKGEEKETLPRPRLCKLASKPCKGAFSTLPRGSPTHPSPFPLPRLYNRIPRGEY